MELDVLQVNRLALVKKPTSGDAQSIKAAPLFVVLEGLGLKPWHGEVLSSANKIRESMLAGGAAFDERAIAAIAEAVTVSPRLHVRQLKSDIRFDELTRLYPKPTRNLSKSAGEHS